MIKRIIKYLIILVILFAVGYWIYFEVQLYLKKGEKPRQMPPTVVNVATSQEQEWYNQIKAVGTMSAFQGIMLKPQVSGQVTNIYFEDGTFIEKGQPIFQIYPDIIEADLAKNKAALKLSQLDYERGVELYKKRVISRQDLDTLTSNLQQNEAAVAKSEAQLVQYNITAPFSGMLGLRLVDLGSYVSIGDNLVQLQQITPIRAQFTVPEVYITELALGQTVDIKASDVANKTYKGVVYAFDSGVDPNNRSLGIRAKVPNENRELIPGTFVEITLYAGKKHPVITVPQTAINYSTEGLYIYRVIDDKAVKTTVTIGLRKNDDVEVTSGLKAKEVVVTAGQIKLSDNSPVIIAPAKNPKSANSSQTLSTPGQVSPGQETSNKTDVTKPKTKPSSKQKGQSSSKNKQ